jgi:plastocyanin
MATRTRTARPSASRGGAARPAGGQGRPLRPANALVQVAGLVVITATMIAGSVAVFVTHPPLLAEAIVFVGPFMIASGLAAWLCWRRGTGARVFGVVVGLATGALFGLEGWNMPDSIADFALALGTLAGSLLAVVGGVAALRAERRGHLVDSSTPAERRAVGATVGLLVLALTASTILTLLARESVNATAAAGATRVDMAGFAFEPSPISAQGPQVRLLVHNADTFMHDVAIPALGLDAVRATPGSTVLVDLADVTPGSYVVYCTLHSDTTDQAPGDDQMTAVLIVE